MDAAPGQAASLSGRLNSSPRDKELYDPQPIERVSNVRRRGSSNRRAHCKHCGKDSIPFRARDTPAWGDSVKLQYGDGQQEKIILSSDALRAQCIAGHRVVSMRESRD